MKRESRKKKASAATTRGAEARAKARRTRDDFSAAVLRHIAQEVGYVCSNPACRCPTSGPSAQKGISNVGVGAHITAAAPGGPRYESSMTPEERSSTANAIWLCNNCGRLVDNDTTTYTVAQLAQWKVDAIERARKVLASGGRSTTEGLFAAHLELQKQMMEHQRAAQDAQQREHRLSQFRDAYAVFLARAKAFAQATEDYWAWMYKTGYQPDRPTREAMQKPVRDAWAAMEQALQPILLIDTDKTRGELRWELIRRRGLEPVIDTIQNQRAYAEVIHYHQLRLLDGINRLQEAVMLELGHPPEPRSEADRAFTEKSITDAKVKADVVEADIKAQYEAKVKEFYARGGRF